MLRKVAQIGDGPLRTVWSVDGHGVLSFESQTGPAGSKAAHHLINLNIFKSVDDSAIIYLDYHGDVWFTSLFVM